MPVPGPTRGEFIGPDLLAARTRMGLSQAELAVCLGLHWNTIARWERNESPVGSAPLLILALEGLEARFKAHAEAAERKAAERKAAE